MMARHWYEVHHMDVRARLMADRHYSRQKPGTPEFTRPGNKIVLLHFGDDGNPVALWASQRPDPDSGISRSDGLDAWDCSIFRNEGARVLSSELIREAVAITWGKWGNVPPLDGFITTVDPKHVKPTMVRGRPVWGYCFLRAGFVDIGRTKKRNLVLLQFDLAQLCQVEPVQPRSEQIGLWEAA
jgi:hypothetical protein